MIAASAGESSIASQTLSKLCIFIALHRNYAPLSAAASFSA